MADMRTKAGAYPDPPTHAEAMEAHLSRKVVRAYMGWLEAGKPRKRGARPAGGAA